jgi:hypothetical protein
MQMVKKVAGFFLVLWVALIVFMPKEEFYFSLEKVLAKQGIETNEAQISEGLFSLNLHDLAVYAKGIKMATIQDVECFTLLFYTHITITGITVDNALKSMLPTKIEKQQFTYSVFDPRHIQIEVEGSFGVATGTIDLVERKVHIDFEKSAKLGSFRSQLKHGEEGWYYESTY